MGGFANIIGGAAGPMQDYGKQLREQAFQHQQNELNRWQLQHAALADAISRASGRYAGPEGERLRDLEIETHSLRPGTELTPYFQKYTQHRQKAEQEIAQRAVQGAQGGGGGAAAPPAIPPVGGAPAPQAPLAPMMGAGSPVNPVQGGAGATGATFPSPTAVQPAAPAAAVPLGNGGAGLGAPIPPVAAAGNGAASPASNAALPAGSALLGLGSPLDLQRSFDAFNNTGYIDPITEAMIPGQAQLATGVQRLPLVQKILEGLQQPQPIDENGQPHMPDISNLLKIEAELSSLGVQGGMGNMLAPMMSAMFAAPSRIPIDATGMSAAEKAQYGLSENATGKYTLMMDRFRNPVGVLPGWAGYQTVTGPTGQVGLVDKNNPTSATPLPAPGGNAINPVFAPQTSSSTLNVPGQLPQTTTTTRQRGVVGAGAGGSGGIRPIVPPAGSGGGTRSSSTPPPLAGAPADNSWMTDNSPIAVNYRAWIAGKTEKLGEKEMLAVNKYAADHSLPTPQVLSPTGQEAVGAVQPILDEIIHARQLLRERGLVDAPEVDSKMKIGKAYIKYKTGFSDPLTKTISDLSFDRIRSVGQALKNTGSRAMPIFKLGLEHTPVIGYGITSDSGKTMDDKLDGMQRRAEESLAAAMRMSKSGVLLGAPPVPATSGGNPAVDTLLKRHGF